MKPDIASASEPSAKTRRSPVVLVVDDSRLQRRVLSASLRRWGYEVVEAGSGDAGLSVCEEISPDLIISDWMMPGMNGPEFCRNLRTRKRDSYSYFILLTSKSESQDVAEGLDSGADDFLSKPFDRGELRARVTAGARLVEMQKELAEKNRIITETLAELQGLYYALDSDLVEARKLQQSLVRNTYQRIGSTDVSLILSPSGHVGGDLVGFFFHSPEQVGLYALDVSGHGISSALMTARLAGYLSPTAPEQNLALARMADGFVPAPLDQTVASLNDLVLGEMDTDHYFTMLLAQIDLVSGEVQFCQAGHPNPVIERTCGTFEAPGSGGLPVGLIKGASFEVTRAKLCSGDRLLLLSDGITECTDSTGNMIGSQGFVRLLRETSRLAGRDRLERIVWHLSGMVGDRGFPDDISAVLVEFDRR